MKIAGVIEQRGRSWNEAPAVRFGEQPMLPRLEEDGYVRIDMTTDLARAAMGGVGGIEILETVHHQSRELFNNPNRTDHNRPDNYAGHRLPGVAEALTGDEPDGNESFLDYPEFDEDGRLREDGERAIPHAEKIRPFRHALGRFTLLSALVVETLLTEVAQEYGQQNPLEFREASVSQINWYTPQLPSQQGWFQPS